MERKIKQVKILKKCPFIIGEKVKFTPDKRTIGWYQHTFERLKIYPGYIGVVTKIKDGVYLYLDNNIGGFAWTSFKKV